MNFYASRAYLDTVAQVYFAGKSTSVQDVQIADKVLRLLVVGKRQVITSVPFLDYHEPLTEAEAANATLKHGFVKVAVQRIVTYEEWHRGGFTGVIPAPYVDWSMFPNHEAFQAYIKPRGKDLLREAARRRRKLATDLGELQFSMNDGQGDVLPLAIAWKSAQLRETGLVDIFADGRNAEFLHELRSRGLLTVSTLRANGRLLSAWLGFVHEGVWSGWIFTYDHDPALKKYSLGRQLLHSMLEEGHRQGHREFDFSTGDEEYKWLYATHARLLGPIGVPPWTQRLMNQAAVPARRLLSRYPGVMKLARSVRRAL